jgi:hypothetical protein
MSTGQKEYTIMQKNTGCAFWGEHEPDENDTFAAEPLSTEEALKQYYDLMPANMARDRLNQIFQEDEQTDPKCQR